MDFRHYLLSRYNVGLYGRKQNMRSGEKIAPKKWMKNRIELFKRYCVPSIRNQSCRNFTWLIVLDPETELGDFYELRDIINGDAELLWGDNFRKTCAKYIEDNLEDENRVITSR